MRKFGLIGYPLTHSFSQKYFTDKFRQEGLSDCSYENFPIASIDELPGIIARMPELEGINVTIPYKQQVISFLDACNDTLPINACNCIRIKNGKTTGYNTDITGFRESLKGLLKAIHKSALVLGNGGAAEAVRYALAQLGIRFQIVSRNIKKGSDLTYDDLTETIVRENLLIINTSPVGMYPNTDACPPIPYDALTADHYLFDLVYNPAKTLFLQKGEERGCMIKNGHDMLVIQADESWRIWNEHLGQ